jgi:hypothetical protein
MYIILTKTHTADHPSRESLTSNVTPTPVKLKNEYGFAFLTDGVTVPSPSTFTYAR